MPRPTPATSAPGPLRPIDPKALRAAADRLADFLEDLKHGGLELATDPDDAADWRVQSAHEFGSSNAVVRDVYGRWQTSSMYLHPMEDQPPSTEQRPSLAERLRALAAEVEAL